MALQMTSFDSETSLNKFLAGRDWSIDEIRLTVDQIPDYRGAGRWERQQVGVMTVYYLLHPSVTDR